MFSMASSWAADRTEKITIDADYMKLNLETGFSSYTGNVIITQGELKLSGDKVTVQQTKNNEVERITVNGKPAHYNHVTEKGENIQAESEQMVYTASENKLVMTVNANLKQPDHQVSSQKIVYDTEKKIVIAGDKDSSTATESGSSSSQRVNITLTPKKDPAKKQK
jgi:lipopolysaccharide export system protein LptA